MSIISDGWSLHSTKISERPSKLMRQCDSETVRIDKALAAKHKVRRKVRHAVRHTIKRRSESRSERRSETCSETCSEIVAVRDAVRDAVRHTVTYIINTASLGLLIALASHLAHRHLALRCPVSRLRAVYCWRKQRSTTAPGGAWAEGCQEKRRASSEQLAVRREEKSEQSREEKRRAEKRGLSRRQKRTKDRLEQHGTFRGVRYLQGCLGAI